MSEPSPYGPKAVRTYRAIIDPLLWRLRPRVVALCRELGVGHVLDIATATGAQCRALGRVGIEATGLDLSEEMIAAARRAGGRNVRYVCGSAYDLPFPDGSFDAALLLLALHEHTEDERSQMVKEALRVVRSEGVLIVAEYTEPSRPRWHAPWQVIRFIEAQAGPDHAAGFLDFTARGCLTGLVERTGLEETRRVRSHVGAIGIAALCPTWFQGSSQEPV